MKKTRQHYKVTGLFDGQHEASVTIDDTGQVPLMHVRPRGGDLYTLKLSDVASIVHNRCVKAKMTKAQLIPILPRGTR